MSRRPTARRNHRIMSPPTLPALRQPHPSLSLQARLLLSLGMAPVLVPLRPSSEHILIVRAPGARDQHGCHSTPFIVRVLRAKRAPGRSLLILHRAGQEGARCDE